MKNLASVEKHLKRCFKEKFTVTTATMVAFLITGSVGYGAQDDYVKTIQTEGSHIIEVELKSGFKGEKYQSGVLNIWEAPKNPEQQEHSVSVINKGSILQHTEAKQGMVGSAAVNIANGADFTNKGLISVDRGGNDIGFAISQGFGGLDNKNLVISSSIRNDEGGRIEIKNVAIASGIGADGYKKGSGYEGKNELLVENNGEIKIHSLTDRELTTGELNAWNLLKGSKFKSGTIEGSGAIGGGIVVGNLVSVKNNGKISIDNATPMEITGTLRNGEVKSIKIGGVGIASAHDVTKNDGKRVTVENLENGEILLTGDYMLGIAAVGGVDVSNAGKIEINGADGVGVLVGEGSTLKNSGIIIANGERSFAILGNDSDNSVDLLSGSHIEGLIDLGAGNDTINIEGVRGENGTAEVINAANVERLNINNSNIEFIGKIETAGTAVVLNNKAGNNEFKNSGEIIAKTGIMISNDNNDQSLNNPNLVKILNGKNGRIEATAYGLFNNAYNTKYNKTEIINEGEILINDFIETTSGGKPYIYSNGIYSANRPNAVERGYVENRGTLTMMMSDEDNLRAKELYETSSGDMYANIHGIRLHENTEGHNTGTISINAHTGIGVAITSGDTGANGLEEYGYFSNRGTVETIGGYTVGVQLKNSTTAKLEAVNETNGIIKLTGKDSVGIYAKGNATATNKGTIALNVLSEGEYSGNIAMKAVDGATVSSTGTIQLTDIEVKEVSEEELLKLESFVKDTLMVGGEHTGIITNASGNVILAAGEEVKDKIEDVLEDEVIKSDDTVTIVGGKLDGVLNAGENFVVEDGKFLAKVESEELTIGGTINSGNANAVEIGEGSTVTVTGSINSESVAFNLEKGAALMADGASIKGDITSTGSSEISLENATQLAGNILLGAGDDKLTIDSSTANLFGKNIVIDGGEGSDELLLGTKGQTTTIKGDIKNFDNKKMEGVVILESDANIVATTAKGDITLGKDSLLVVRISGDENHAFTDIDGNTVTTDSNGKVMLETDNLNIGTDGKAVIDLAGTKLNIAEKDIIASQYVYDITFAPVRMEGTLLNVSLKTLKDMGINSKYQGAFSSIVTSGNLSAISNSTAVGKQSALENLLGQIVEMNPYAVSANMSHDSMMGWNNGIKSLRDIPETGEWMVQATGTGNYENYKGDIRHESNTTGLLATAEYGIMKDTSLGFAFGGGKQTGELKNSSSDLESDTFYLGAFAKKKIENFRFLGSLGYQKNRFDADRVIDNGLDRFDFAKSFDTDGFSAMLETRYIVPVNETLTVEPKLVLDYTHISQDSIDEGADPMGMKIDSHKIGTYGAEVGVDLVKTFVGDNGYSGKAFAGLAYGYTGGDTDRNLEASVGNGSKFDIESVDMDNSRGKATVGVEIQNRKGLSYGIGYTYEAGKDTRDSKVTLGLGYKF